VLHGSRTRYFAIAGQVNFSAKYHTRRLYSYFCTLEKTDHWKSLLIAGFQVGGGL
jgi:hypothetical protein